MRKVALSVSEEIGGGFVLAQAQTYEGGCDRMRKVALSVSEEIGRGVGSRSRSNLREWRSNVESSSERERGNRARFCSRSRSNLRGRVKEMARSGARQI